MSNRAPDNLQPATDWRHQARCKGTDDPDLWHPIGSTGAALLQIAEATAVCRRCPVMDQCLDYALDHNIHDGVWGGMSEDERRSYRRHQLRARTANKAAAE